MMCRSAELGYCNGRRTTPLFDRRNPEHVPSVCWLFSERLLCVIDESHSDRTTGAVRMVVTEAVNWCWWIMVSFASALITVRWTFMNLESLLNQTIFVSATPRWLWTGADRFGIVVEQVVRLPVCWIPLKYGSSVNQIDDLLDETGRQPKAIVYW